MIFFHETNPYVPVLLSILIAPQQRFVWERITDWNPDTILSELKEREDLRTLPHIAADYGPDAAGAAGRIIERTASQGVRIVHYWERCYPSILRQIQNPPVALYVRGPLPETTRVAVVGTRKADPISLQVCYRLSSELSGAGITVVSGIALGIDREAHRGALRGPGGTVAVLANGIDVVYPAANADIFNAIGASSASAILSEYPPGVIAGKWTFIRRNRIISGLSRGTVVVKAGERSGALITARYAAEQNREVFACPGYAYNEEYRGCHDLIRSGAVLVSGTGDILQEMEGLDFHRNLPSRGAPEQVFFGVKRTGYDEDSIEGKIIQALLSGTMNADELIRKLGYGAAESNRAFIRLELDGAIIRNGNFISRA